MTQYMTQVTSDYFHSFISASDTSTESTLITHSFPYIVSHYYKYRAHSLPTVHHYIQIDHYYKCTDKYKTFYQKHNLPSHSCQVLELLWLPTISLGLLCLWHLSILKNRLIRGRHMLVMNQLLLIVFLPHPKITSTTISLSTGKQIQLSEQ